MITRRLLDAVDAEYIMGHRPTAIILGEDLFLQLVTCLGVEYPDDLIEWNGMKVYKSMSNRSALQVGW